MINEDALRSVIKASFRRLGGVEVLDVHEIGGIGWNIDFAIGKILAGRDMARCIFTHRIGRDELQYLEHDKQKLLDRIGEPIRRLQQLVEDATAQGRAEGKQEAKEDLRAGVLGAMEVLGKALRE